MSEAVVCGFCRNQMKPRRSEDEKGVTYWCTECNSIIAAYLKDFERLLKFGSLFHKYTLRSV